MLVQLSLSCAQVSMLEDDNFPPNVTLAKQITDFYNLLSSIIQWCIIFQKCMLVYLFMTDNLDSSSEHFMQQPPL